MCGRGWRSCTGRSAAVVKDPDATVTVVLAAEAAGHRAGTEATPWSAEYLLGLPDNRLAALTRVLVTGVMHRAEAGAPPTTQGWAGAKNRYLVVDGAALERATAGSERLIVVTVTVGGIDLAYKVTELPEAQIGTGSAQGVQALSWLESMDDAELGAMVRSLAGHALDAQR